MLMLQAQNLQCYLFRAEAFLYGDGFLENDIAFIIMLIYIMYGDAALFVPVFMHGAVHIHAVHTLATIIR